MVFFWLSAFEINNERSVVVAVLVVADLVRTLAFRVVKLVK